MKLSALLLPVALCACTSIVPSTIAKLSTLSPLEADPADIAVALRLPEGIGIQPGSALLSLSAKRDDTAQESAADYTLASAIGPDGARLYSISETDWKTFRALQALINSWEQEAPDSTNGSLGVSLGGCRTGAEIAPDATIDINIRTERDGNFLPLLRDAKLTSVFKTVGISELPDCE